MKLTLLIFCIIIALSFQEVAINGNEECFACLGENKKVCKHYFLVEEGYCCDLDDNSYNCGGNEDAYWSDSLSQRNFDQDRYLIWGTHKDCGFERNEVENYGHTSISPRVMPTKGTCLHEVVNIEDNSLSIYFDNTTSRNVDLHLYHRSEGIYQNLGPLWNQEYPLLNYQHIQLLAIPTSDRDPTFETFAQSTEAPKKKRLSAGAIVGITLGSAFVVLLIAGCIFFLIRTRGKLNKNSSNSHMDSGINRQGRYGNESSADDEMAINGDNSSRSPHEAHLLENERDANHMS